MRLPRSSHCVGSSLWQIAHIAGGHALLVLLLEFFPPQPHAQQRVAVLEGVLVGLGDDHLERLVAPQRRLG